VCFICDNVKERVIAKVFFYHLTVVANVLSILHNYFDDPIRLFSHLYLARFLDISTKPFFSCMTAVATRGCRDVADFHDARRKLISDPLPIAGGDTRRKTAEMRSVGVYSRKRERKKEK